MMLVILAFVVLAVAQLAVGFLGIEHGYGTFWASVALFAALGLRFTLPMTIGAFFGATNMLGWHWFPALLFTLPGLAFMIPGVLAAGVVAVREQMSGSQR